MGNARAELAADPDLGIGNVLATLVARGERLDQPAVTFDTALGDHPAWQPFTLRQLDRAAATWASWLCAHRVGPRDPVAVYVSSAADQILAFLALTRIGAIPALINRNVPPQTAATYLKRLGPSALVTDDAHRSALGTALSGLPSYDTAALMQADPASAPAQWRHHPADAAVITHSSGTTGLPKAVIATHSSLFASVRHRLGLPRGQVVDRMLSALPTNHAAMVIALSLALCNQSELLMLSDQAGPAVLSAAQRWRPSCVLGFAATWPELVAQDLSRYDLDSIQLFWNTGDCAHEAHIRKLLAVGSRMIMTRDGAARVPGAAFVDGLGSTEMGHSLFFITHTPASRRYGRCVGRPHAFAEVTLLDEAGDEVPVGQVGQLGVRSPTLSPGYWNDSVTTYRTRLRGYFLTGDLMYRDEEGYYYHVDRQVDAAGLPDGRQLYTALSEERVLAACPDVLDATMVALRGDDGGIITRVLLTLAAGTGRPAGLADRVRAALEPHVAATVRSVEVVTEDEVPHGPTGKVRKVLLREQLARAR